MMNFTTAASDAGGVNRTFQRASDDNSLFGSWVQPAHLIKILTTIFVPLAFGLIVLIGIFGNALVIIVVATNSQMRSTTNMLILNLAVADLLFIILCVPFTATDYILNFWPFGLVWCQTVQYLIYATSYVSIYTLILMSIDRFMAVVFPVSNGNMQLFVVY
jgi:allatostatin receptor